MASRVLFVPCFPGELGWELLNYVPHVKWLVSHGSYHRVVVVVRKGRERLYPFATEYISSRLEEDLRVSGNIGPKTRVRVAESNMNVRLVQDIVRKGFVCDCVDLRRFKGLRVVAKRECIKYSAEAKSVIECRRRFGERYVVVLPRLRSFGRKKNWPIERYNLLAREISKSGYVPVFVGSGVCPSLKYGVNLVGQTTVNDVISILCGSKFAIGQSTGSVHLASLCGVRHLVWGDDRLKTRYEKDWNPFGTEVCFIGGGWNVPVSFVVKRLKGFLR